MKGYVLDACALIAYINDEEGADIIERLLDEADSGESEITMGKINLLEVYYGILRELGGKKADDVLAEIQQLPVRIISDIGDALFREAARIKASYRLSLADALALGLASVSGAQIVTADHHELDVIETRESVGFLWIR